MLATLGDVLALVGFFIVGLLVWAAFSPFETLGWWAGWFGDTIYAEEYPSDGLVRAIRPNADSYIVFFSGVGRVSGETLSYRERDFLRRLAVTLPRTVVIDDIFPYSVNNLPLTGQPFFSWIWRWALQRKLNGPQLAGYLINIRNIWQVGVSLDKRYGPIYNQSMAEVILHGLLRYDYDGNGAAPVFIIGYSGAAQMAIGAVTYLRERIRGPIYVISLGGIFSSDPGLLVVDQLYHLFGTADRAHGSSYLMPGRWPLFVTSEWNRARRQKRITAINVGPISHTGAGGYLDTKSELPDGTSFVDKTVATIADIVHRNVAAQYLNEQTGVAAEALHATERGTLQAEPG